jgi:uncharacterized membrane protein
MSLGPIEFIVIGFPETPSGGRIASEIQSLVDREVVTLVDGLLISKDDDGEVTYVEIEQADADQSIKALSDLLGEAQGLVAEEDVDEIAAQLEPGASALMLVFENTWLKPVRDAIADAGGILMANLRVPGPVVEEVMVAAATA